MLIIKVIITIQFNSLFIYVLNPTANGQLQSQHEYKQQENTGQNNKKTIKRKMYQLRLFKLKHELLKIFIYLQTTFAADTHLAEGQWLKERLNVVKLRIFRVGTRMTTVSRTEGQYLMPQKTFIKNNASK
jgi:hypothetical protein